MTGLGFLWMNGCEVLNDARTHRYLTSDASCMNCTDAPRMTWYAPPDPALLHDPCNDNAPIELGPTPDAAGFEAPWYVASRPDTASFLGLLVLSITGIDEPVDAERSVRTIANARGGAVFGPSIPGVREITVRALAFACDDGGLTYGMRWLTNRLANDCLECWEGEARVREFVDANDLDRGLWSLRRVTMLDKPSWTAEAVPVRTGCRMRELTFRLGAGDPYLYSCESTCLDWASVGQPIDTGGCVTFCDWYQAPVEEADVCCVIPGTDFGTRRGAIVRVKSGPKGTGRFWIRAWKDRFLAADGVYTDNFERADSASLGASWDEGSSHRGWAIDGGIATVPDLEGHPFAKAIHQTGQQQHYIQGIVAGNPTAAHEFGFIALYEDLNNFAYCLWEDPDWGIYRRVAGVDTRITAVGPWPTADGTPIKFAGDATTGDVTFTVGPALQYPYTINTPLSGTGSGIIAKTVLASTVGWQEVTWDTDNNCGSPQARWGEPCAELRTLSGLEPGETLVVNAATNTVEIVNAQGVARPAFDIITAEDLTQLVQLPETECEDLILSVAPSGYCYPDGAEVQIGYETRVLH